MKYELIEEDFIVNAVGVKLFRIRYTKTKELGGYIESEKNLDQNGDAWVYGNAWVYGDARVYGDAWEKSPLYIQGTKNSLTHSRKGYLRIGCVELKFSEWISNYKEIGKKYRYTADEIKEYGILIRAFVEMCGGVELLKKDE